MKRWPLHKVWFWETAPFFRVLVPLVAGILAYTSITAKGINIAWLITALSIMGACLLLYVILLRIKKHSFIRSFAGLELLNIIIFLGGWSLCYVNDIQHDKPWFGRSVGSDRSYVARISEAPAEKENSWKITVSVLSRINGNTVFPAIGQAFLYVKKDSARMPFHAGDTLLLPNKWQPIRNPGNPYEFDYARYCARNNLYYQQFLSRDDVFLYGRAAGKDRTIVERSHYWCMQQLDTYVKDTVAKGLIQAMLIGDEINLDPDLRQAYAETGIVHIIAISGANVGIFFIVVSWLLWWLRNKKHEWIKYLAALPLVWFYVVVAGSQPSAMRAAVMFTVLAFGLLLDKNKNNLNQLFAAAVLLLCAQPMWFFSIGFQLSFVALLSLILFYPAIYGLYKPPNKPVKLFWATIVASLAAEILVAPLVIYYFHLFPLLFLISNVIAFIFMGVVTILAVLIVAFSYIPIIAKGLAGVAVCLVTYFDRIVYWLRHLNPDSFRYLQISGVELALLYGCIAGMAFFVLRREKPALFAGLGLACALLAALSCDRWTALHQERLVVYNMNKASCIEWVHGNKYTIVNPDTAIPETKKQYTLKPAHTAWQAWREDSILVSNVMSIGNKTVLLLNRHISYSGRFPVDYVVLNYDAQPEEIDSIETIFTPKKIVLDNGVNHSHLYKIMNMRKHADVPVHVVANDGAFVLDK